MTLSETWFLEGYIDFDLQKYRLLAYLKEVDSYFNETKLYPKLSDIIFHYNNLVTFRENKRLMQDQFPKQLDQVNLQQLELVYEQMLADDDIMNELERITDFAAQQMKSTITNGAEIYEFVEKQTRIEPIGILPLYKDEGYILLRYGQYTEIRAYVYNMTLFEHQDARYRGVKIDFVKSWTKSITNTYEHIKREIIRINPALPNPAVFCVETALQVPFNETFLPIAKRMLMRHLSSEQSDQNVSA